MARQWKRQPPTPEATSVTECARRYHACAVALAKSFGLPMTTAFLQEYHSAISCVYIEAGRAGVRLPSGVAFPPLNGDTPPPVRVTTAPPSNGRDHAEPVPDGVTRVTAPNGHTPQLTAIPTDAGLPCAGQAIPELTPTQLAMLVSKVARLVSDGADQWVPLLHALQSERASRLAKGRQGARPPAEKA
jgi:hypothetical protein